MVELFRRRFQEGHANPVIRKEYEAAMAEYVVVVCCGLLLLFDVVFCFLLLFVVVAVVCCCCLLLLFVVVVCCCCLLLLLFVAVVADTPTQVDNINYQRSAERSLCAAEKGKSGKLQNRTSARDALS